MNGFFRKFASGAVCVVLALARQASAAAEVTPEKVAVQGECPSREAVETALADRGILPLGEGVTVAVVADRGGAKVTIRLADAQVLLERHINSDDCTALADAIALIVEAQFVGLGATEERVEKDSSPARSEPPPVPAPVAAERARAGVTPSTVPRNVHLEALAGGGVEIPGSLWPVTGAFRLGLGLGWGDPALSLRMDAMTVLPANAMIPDRVRRQTRRALVTGSTRVFTSPGLELWTGVGLSNSTIRAVDLPQSSTQSIWSPVVAAGIAVVQPLAGCWRMRVDLGCYASAYQEAYRISPDGELARGPRFGCNLLPGLEWSGGAPSAGPGTGGQGKK